MYHSGYPSLSVQIKVYLRTDNESNNKENLWELFYLTWFAQVGFKINIYSYMYRLIFKPIIKTEQKFMVSTLFFL